MTPTQAANILVDNDTRCVISDFGQSEMKSEVYRITRASQPRMFEYPSNCYQHLTRSNSVPAVGGTLRWQAPELMQGTQTLTPEIDVYAFAICCGEILTMGDLPWPFMDDDAVRHLVLSGYHLLHYSAVARVFMVVMLTRLPSWTYD